MADNKEVVAQVLIEYGQAWRGDWSFFDGRGCRDDMEAAASWLRSDKQVSLVDARNMLGVCPDGGAHWPEYCQSNECPTDASYRVIPNA